LKRKWPILAPAHPTETSAADSGNASIHHLPSWQGSSQWFAQPRLAPNFLEALF
jgi:hypothetical protein